MLTRRIAAGLSGLLLVIAIARPAAGQYWSTYPTHAQIGQALLNFQTAYPNLCKRVSIGASGQGRELWAVCISDNVNVEEDEPEFRYVSTIHGDEQVGVVNCLNLINYLLSNYGTVQRATDIVNNIELWVMPCFNPDGLTAMTRGNANGVDINRNFPDPYTSPNNTTAGREVETAAMMQWAWSRSFIMSANFHGGALVVNYPYDANASGNNVYTACPDDDVAINVSEAYSITNIPLWNSASFFHGITNGADWYVVYGGLQDWSYRYNGCMDLTIELGNTKKPAESQLPTLWNDNRDSMLSLAEKVLIGVRGVITDARSGLPLGATIRVVGRDHDVYTDPDVGDYHRVLLPGSYDLTVNVPNYDQYTMTAVPVAAGPATRRDVQMWTTLVSYPNGGETLNAGSPTNVTWSSWPTAQFQVQYAANYGAMTPQTDDFERSLIGSNYATGGNANWYITSSASHSPTRSVRAGIISHNQTSWMTRNITAGGTVSFWYGVASEAGADIFRFYVDGVVKLTRSGSQGWTQFSTPLTAGPHLLRWEYTKNGSVSVSSDTVWIDDVSVSADATTWTDIIALTSPGVQTAPWTPPAPGTTYKVRVRPYFGSGVYGAWDDSNAVFSVVPGANGDADEDGDVDLADFAVLQNCFGQAANGACARLDFDGGGVIDAADVTEFVNRLQGPHP